MTIGEVLESFLRLPERIQSVEKGIDFVLNNLSNVQTLLGIVQKAVRTERPDPTFVYLLPPDIEAPDPPSTDDEIIGVDAAPPKTRLIRVPFYAQCMRLKPGERDTMIFPSYYDIPPGMWVVAVGPATIRSVRVGNMSQEAVADFAGHVCKTRDRWQVGVHLIVHLEGN